MGEISKRIHRKLASNTAHLPFIAPNRRAGERLPSGIRDVPTLIRGGLDPVHAAYAFIQQMSSLFAEGVSQFPEMKAYAERAGAAEEEYMPSGPPMSPLTGSYFTCWAFYDLQFGRGGETIGQCQIDANDLIGMNPDQLDALRKLSSSRMGIYEHVGMDGPHVRLRELITDDEFICRSTSGYTGKKGELWYVRLLPPLVPELAAYHVIFTTPYLLMNAKKVDWVTFLRRTMLRINETEERKTLSRLLKYGPDTNYWNEFVFKGYHSHQHGAIFLAGIPDVKSTLPHA